MVNSCGWLYQDVSIQKNCYTLSLFCMQEFQAGALVLLQNSKRDTKKGDKMQQKWLGPYTVVASLGNGLYRIQNKATERILKRAVHCARLKEYIMSNDPDCSKQCMVCTCTHIYNSETIIPHIQLLILPY